MIRQMERCPLKRNTDDTDKHRFNLGLINTITLKSQIIKLFPAINKFTKCALALLMRGSTLFGLRSFLRSAALQKTGTE